MRTVCVTHTPPYPPRCALQARGAGNFYRAQAQEGTNSMIQERLTLKDITAAGLPTRRPDQQTGPRAAPDAGEVQLCRDWLKAYAEKTNTPRPRSSSYGLKHVVETWAGTYVSNGAFIVAAMLEGYTITPSGPDSLNAHFNMSLRKWKARKEQAAAEVNRAVLCQEYAAELEKIKAGAQAKKSEGGKSAGRGRPKQDRQQIAEANPTDRATTTIRARAAGTNRRYLQAAEKLLGWIMHLSEKRWVTGRMIGELVLAVSRRHGVKVERGL